ncbi:MAG: FAD-dependent oxidoreductase, partial [Myxococcota bacterium]
MGDSAHVLIVGGGVIGSGLAWALAERGIDEVVVVDLDLAGVYASSELNAGGARATWWQPVNVEACRVTLDFFGEHAMEFGFQPVGYLWLFDDPALFATALEKRELQNAVGLAVECLEPAEVEPRFPIVDRALDELVGATYSPRDGLVNPNAVRRWYRSRAEERGVRFLDRHYVSGVSTGLLAGTGAPRRRVIALDVVEVARGDPTDEAGMVRGILTRHHIPASARAAESRISCDLVVNCL